jgi:hypothetical protein
MGTEKEFGQALVYGLYDTVTGLVVQSDSWTVRYALDIEVQDEEGRVITNRLDDERNEITIDGVIKVHDAVLPGNTLTYGGLQWIVKDVTDRGSNTEYRKLSIKAVKYQEIA